MRLLSLQPYEILVCSAIFLGLGAIGLRVAQKFHWSLALLFIWATFSGVANHYMPVKYFEHMGPVTASALPLVSGESVIMILALVVPFLIFEINEKWLIALGIINTFFVLFNHSGVMLDHTQDAGLMALIFALCLKDKYYVSMAVLCVAVALQGSSTGFAGIGAALCGYLLAKKNKLVWVPAVVVPTASYLLVGKELINPNGRQWIWAQCWRWFSENIPPWYGAGLGTFIDYGPSFQGWDYYLAHKTLAGLPVAFAWPHNEIVGIGFELGYIGVALTLLVAGFALLRAWATPWKFASLLAILPPMMLQMPFRHPVSAFVVLYVIGQSLREISPDRNSDAAVEPAQLHG